MLAATGQAVAPTDLLGLDYDALEQLVAGRFGVPRYRARQLWDGMHRQSRLSIDDIATLPAQLRREIGSEFVVSSLEPVVRLTSADRSTDKALYRLPDGELIETVLMRYVADGHRRPRKTVCVSSQAGCALGCTFCATGQQGFRRQLTVGEIVGQVIDMQRVAERDGDDDGSGECGITNVVFMGMGEPLANYDNTLAAIRIINDARGIGIGARHITVSTVGLVPPMLKLAREGIQVNLAVSLHAPDDATRSETVPVNRRYPLSVLISACHQYVEMTGRRIFFEYVLLRGQNDSIDHAQRLGGLLSGLNCHVNLIPVNPTGDGPYGRTKRGDALKFQQELRTWGVPSTVRMEKGIDIDAGCGQLRARVLDADGALS